MQGVMGVFLSNFWVKLALFILGTAWIFSSHYVFHFGNWRDLGTLFYLLLVFASTFAQSRSQRAKN